MVVTSAVGLLLPGKLATEDIAGDPRAPGAVRLAAEETALALAAKGVRSRIARLPPIVHDRNKQGLVTRMTGLAQEKDVLVYVGNGLNRWPGVHVLDAAKVFRLALEKGWERLVRSGSWPAMTTSGVSSASLARCSG